MFGIMQMKATMLKDKAVTKLLKGIALVPKYIQHAALKKFIVFA